MLTTEKWKNYKIRDAHLDSNPSRPKMATYAGDKTMRDDIIAFIGLFAIAMLLAYSYVGMI